MSLRISLLASAVVGACSPHVLADLVAYQGFDGYAAGPLPGQATGAQTLGLTTANITSAGTGANANVFEAVGLTFSNLVTQGGSGLYSDATGRPSYIGFGYSGPTVTGTLYTSYLVKLVTAQNALSAVSLRANATSTTGGGSAYFQTYADSVGSTFTGSQYEGNSLNTASTHTLATGTTFVVIGRFTNVGTALSAGTPGQATTFVLNAAQFDYFKDGGFTDAELDAALVGTGASNVTSRISDAPVTTGTYTLTSGNGIQFGPGNSGVSQTVAYDELRFGTTLDHVLPLVPGNSEPDPVNVALVATAPIAQEPTAAGDAAGSFTLTRQGDTTQPLRIYLSTGGTATNAVDYPEIPASVLIPAGASSLVIPVPAYTDRVVEGDETVTLTITAGSGYIVPLSPTDTITLTDRPEGAIATRGRFVQKLGAGLLQKIVVYGTSLTAGGAWPAQMKAALDFSWPGQTTVLNRASSGMASDWGAANLTTQVISAAPDVVFIEFSVNDAVARFDIPLAEARANLESMIDGIQAAHPQCEIILQVMNPVIGRPQGDPGWRPHLEHYQQIYRDVAAERDLLLIDHHPAWQALLDQAEFDFYSYVPDGLHPSVGGDETFVTPQLLQAIGAPRRPAPTIFVDDFEATLVGDWTASFSTAGSYQGSYLTDGNAGKGSKSATFTPDIPAAGTYPVYLRWSSLANRASNVPVTVNHVGGSTQVVVNQAVNGGIWFKLGDFALSAGTANSVVIETTGTNGFVIADAVAVETPSVSLRVSNGRLAEPTGGQTALATITRSGPLTQALQVGLTLGGTAINGTDYNLLSATVTIPANASSVTFSIVPKADAAFEGPETLTLEIVPSGSVQARIPAKASITIVDPGDSPFVTWQLANFDAVQLANPAISGPEADPDNDGLSNLLESFTGLLPLVPNGNPVGFSTVDVGGTEYLALTYPRAPGTGLTGTPEISDDLVVWKSGDAFLESSADAEPGNLQQVTVRSRAALGLAAREFLRLQVTP